MNEINKKYDEKKLRLLIISADKFPPFRVDVSILFGEEIVKKGHKIDWILQSADNCSKSYVTKWKNCTVYVGKTDNGVSLFSKFRKYIYAMVHDFKIFSLMKQNRYDIIQVKDKFFAALLAIIASKIYKVPFVYWLSFPFPEARIYSFKVKTARYPYISLFMGLINKFLLYKIILPHANHIFVQSEQMKKDIARHGIPLDKMTSVPMGVSLKDIPYNVRSSKNKKIIKPSNEKWIVYLGTLNRTRRIDFLIRVLYKVLKKIPEARLILVGKGGNPEDEEFLKKEAKRLDILKYIIFTGFLPMKEAWEYIREADVCVSPYYPIPILLSTSPTKLVEYMAMGKPVVANDHPEQRLVIEQSGGGICVPYDENAFAEAIIQLLNDPEKAKEMGYRGRQYVEKYRCYSKISEIVENKYFQILEMRS